MTQNFDNHDNLLYKFGTEVPKDDVNIGYFDVPDLSIDNIDLIDQSATSDYSNTSKNSEETVWYTDTEQQLINIDDRDLTTVPNPNFYLTDIRLNDKTEINQETPLYFEYIPRYKHVDVKNATDQTIKNNISLVYSDQTVVNQSYFPYAVEVINEEDYTADTSLSTYRFKIYLNFRPTSDQNIGLSYNPTAENLSSDYIETLNPQKIFQEDSINNVEANQGNIDYKRYGLQETSSGEFELTVPIKAQSSEDDIHYYQLQEETKAASTYQVIAEGLKKSETKGVAVAFCIDTSGSMSSSSGDVNNAMTEFMNYISQDDDIENHKYAGIYFASSVKGGISDNSFKDSITPKAEASGGTQFEPPLNKAINMFKASQEELENYKKTILFMSDGRDNDEVNITSTMKSRASEAGIDSIWSVGFGSGADADALKKISTEIIPIPPDWDGDSDRYFNADSDSLESAYKQIAESSKPKEFSQVIIPEQYNLVPNEKITFDERANRGLKDNMGIIKANYILKYNPQDIVNAYFEDVKTGTDYGTQFSYETDGNIHVSAIADHKTSLWSRKYYLKYTNSDSYKKYSNQIYAELPNNADKYDNWYLRVHKGFFIRQDGDITYDYNLPEYNYQDFYQNNPPNMQSKEEPEIVDDKTIKLSRSPLNIETTTKTILNESTGETGEVITPSNIRIYSAASGREITDEFAFVDWDEESGELVNHTKLPRTDIVVEYTFKQYFYQYRGYRDLDDNFIHLDLNPRQGHTYTELKSDGTTVTKPTYKLFNKMIYLYVKPQIKYDDDEPVIGSKSPYTLFHTIGQEVSDNHPFLGEHYSAEDANLLAKLYINPPNDFDELIIRDTRTRGGGIKEKFVNQIKDIHPEVKYYWDIGNWNGKAFPQNGVIVIEVPKKVLDKLTKQEVTKKVEKHVAAGVLPVIKYV